MLNFLCLFQLLEEEIRLLQHVQGALTKYKVELNSKDAVFNVEFYCLFQLLEEEIRLLQGALTKYKVELNSMEAVFNVKNQMAGNDLSPDERYTCVLRYNCLCGAMWGHPKVVSLYPTE